MIDLTPVENMLTAASAAIAVDGVASMKQAIDKGINTQNAFFVMPLLSPSAEVNVHLQENETHERFAVIIALKTGGNSKSNAELNALHQSVLDAVWGKTIAGFDEPIKLGNGGLLPTKLIDHVFWQIEFSLRTFTRAS